MQKENKIHLEITVEAHLLYMFFPCTKEKQNPSSDTLQTGGQKGGQKGGQMGRQTDGLTDRRPWVHWSYNSVERIKKL